MLMVAGFLAQAVACEIADSNCWLVCPSALPDFRAGGAKLRKQAPACRARAVRGCRSRSFEVPIAYCCVLRDPY